MIAQKEVLLNPRDVVVLDTDGIPEAFDINKKQYGLKMMSYLADSNPVFSGDRAIGPFRNSCNDCYSLSRELILLRSARLR